MPRPDHPNWKERVKAGEDAREVLRSFCHLHELDPEEVPAHSRTARWLWRAAANKHVRVAEALRKEAK